MIAARSLSWPIRAIRSLRPAPLAAANDRVRLLHGFDPVRPDEPYWLVPGGGANAGESLAEAAARELREETGISVRSKSFAT
jgi:8-oxo-dGTP pyrophosphatase MutT (NUDIX family)